MSEKMLTSEQVAEMLGMSGKVALLTYLAKNPDLRPQEKYGTAFVWTQAEIDRLIEFRGRAKLKGGRPKGAKNKPKPFAQEGE